MTYSLIISKSATEDFERLKRSEPQAFRKASSLLEELTTHPMTGNGKPERLKGYKASIWSRRISQKHRLFYEIMDSDVIVLVISAYGHYDGK